MSDIAKKLRQDAREFYGMSLDGDPDESEMFVLREDLRWQAADEIERLREIRSGVRVLYYGGQLKKFEGEPWLARALAED